MEKKQQELVCMAVKLQPNPQLANVKSNDEEKQLIMKKK